MGEETKAERAAKRKAEAQRQKNIATTTADYLFVGALADQYPELKPFFKELKAVIANSPTGTITTAEYQAIKSKKNPDGSLVYGWFAKRDADQLAAEEEMARDRLNGTSNYQAGIDVKKSAIQQLSEKYGLPVSDEELTELAKQAKYENWEPAELEAALGAQFGKTGVTGDLRGAAGTFQTELKQWAEKNGLRLSDNQLSQFIQRGAMGKQSLDDAKQELRNMYLKGAYPAWSKYIDEGMDPDDIAAPYRREIATLLEVDDESIGFDDPLLQKALQGVDDKGQPTTVPLWDYKRMIRSDPRWQQTDNAYETYTNVGTELLRMFGFR